MSGKHAAGQLSAGDDRPVQGIVRASGKREYRAARRMDFRFCNPPDIVQIQNQRTPHTVETVIQLFFKKVQSLFDCIIFSAVDRHIVFPDVKIADLIERDSHHFAGLIEIQAAAVLVHFFNSSIHHGIELVLVQRFHQIMQGRDFVAFRDIIRIARNKDDLQGFIALADLFRQGNAVHAVHFNIKQNDVKVFIFRIAEQEGFRRRKISVLSWIFCFIAQISRSFDRYPESAGLSPHMAI